MTTTQDDMIAELRRANGFLSIGRCGKMTTHFRAFVVIAALSGCAGQSASSGPGPFDGAYTGSVQVSKIGLGVQSTTCQTNPTVSLRVADSAFSLSLVLPNFPGTAKPIYPAKIAPDGSFGYDSGLFGNMTGRVVGNHLSATITGSNCSYVIAADRS